MNADETVQDCQNYLTTQIREIECEQDWNQALDTLDCFKVACRWQALEEVHQQIDMCGCKYGIRCAVIRAIDRARGQYARIDQERRR
jgi:hypothetical protein